MLKRISEKMMTRLGGFTGDIIGDNSTISDALQSLENETVGLRAISGVLTSNAGGEGATTIGTEGGGNLEQIRQSIVASSEYGDGVIDATEHLKDIFSQAVLLYNKQRCAIWVTLPIGIFKITEQLQIPNGINVQGSGWGSCLSATDVDGLSALVAINTNNTTVRNLKIEGSGKGSQPQNGSNLPEEEIVLRLSSSGCGVTFCGVSNGRIENIWVDNCGGTTGVSPFNGIAGIYITGGCTDTAVMYNRVTNCRNGINEDNFFCTIDPPNSQSPHGNIITKNWIFDCRFGIGVEGYYVENDNNAKGCRVISNTIARCIQSGIDLNKAQRTIVAFNHIEDCGSEGGNSGIWLYGSSAIPAFDNLIHGNICINNGKSGVGGAGIKVGQNVYYTTISANICNANYGNGIFILGQCRYWTITEGQCRNNRFNGIEIRSADSSNVVTTGSVSSVIVLDSEKNGILLDKASEVTLNAITVKNSSRESSGTYDDIRITNGSTLNIVSSCRCSGGTARYSLAVTDSSSINNTFSTNKFAQQASGRVAFANLSQKWGTDNDDPTPTASGVPSGSQLPYGAEIYNPVDFKKYLSTPSGYRAVVTS